MTNTSPYQQETIFQWSKPLFIQGHAHCDSSCLATVGQRGQLKLESVAESKELNLRESQLIDKNHKSHPPLFWKPCRGRGHQSRSTSRSRGARCHCGRPSSSPRLRCSWSRRGCCSWWCTHLSVWPGHSTHQSIYTFLNLTLTKQNKTCSIRCEHPSGDIEHVSRVVVFRGNWVKVDDAQGRPGWTLIAANHHEGWVFHFWDLRREAWQLWLSPHQPVLRPQKLLSTLGKVILQDLNSIFCRLILTFKSFLDRQQISIVFHQSLP